ncbi:tRNA modification GTPase MnmE [bacterium BMS3Abin03]|nr:tRNA modification GTPase MnmE [bacterium BMS3Abin03]HDZ58450.1 tRNA uridine-5-carboxymethylaminomethyl(34) synthesis GTPase MnmE [Ignavibacteriales bacterium]
MTKIQSEDTIVALATPAGVGAISVIRVSGSEAIETIDKIFKGKKSLAKAGTHTVHYGKIETGEGNFIDDVLVSVFRKPNSYTGEDAVEISTHGNPFITQKIIGQLISNNIRIAEPGEFTKRAFLNNRIDLAQAEAVADVINARTEASLRGSRNQLDGLLSEKVNQLREMLLNASSYIELELDFAEEELEFIDKNELQEKIDSITTEIDKLLSTYSFGRVIRDGVNVALVGKPNVGKSSLLNYMLKESRAIVSEIPGTTRDVIREEVSIDGILFKLFDTAGMRVSEDAIEKEGVLRSREAIKNADLVLIIGDVEQSFSDGLEREIKTLINSENIIKVLNKIDLDKNVPIDADVKLSAKTGEGIDELFRVMKGKAIGASIYSEKTAIVSNIRHFECLKKAKESLITARESVKNRMSGEFIAVDLRNAEQNLAEIIGVVTTDDILNNIFSKFCIGK